MNVMSVRSLSFDYSSIAKRRRASGLSLVELMVALTIGLLLLLGLVEIFGASRAAFSSAEGSARIQENSRFALEFLRRDVRMAGHVGCLNELGYQAMPDLLFNHNVPGPTMKLDDALWAMRIDMPVEAYEYRGTAPGENYSLAHIEPAQASAEWSPELKSELQSIIGSASVPDAISGSDVLVLRYLEPESVGLDGLGVNAGVVDAIVTDPAWTTLDPFVEAGRIYAVTNCRTFSLFQATEGANSDGQFKALPGVVNRFEPDPLDRPDPYYGWLGNEVYASSGTRLYRYQIAVYYVGVDTGGQPALFIRNFKNDAAQNYLGERRALVDGVESIQLVFGRDIRNSEGDDLRDDYADSYGSAADISGDVAEWRQVISMRIGLLLRSSSPSSAVNSGATPTPIRVADTVITPPDDSRLRSSYESMVSIRNRVRN